jgi:hypothetical protein
MVFLDTTGEFAPFRPKEWVPSSNEFEWTIDGCLGLLQYVNSVTVLKRSNSMFIAPSPIRMGRPMSRNLFVLILLTVPSIALSGRHDCMTLLDRDWVGLDHRSAEIWNGFDDQFQTRAIGVLKQNQIYYLDAKAAGDPVIRYMEEIGFRFTNPISVPPLSTIIQRHDQYLDRLIEKGVVTEVEVLRPARVFTMPDGVLIWRRIGEPIPAKASIMTGYAVISEENAFRMLNDGFFLVGEHTPFRNRMLQDNYTIAMHDLAHHFTFALNPKMMGAMRKSAGEILRRGIKAYADDPAVIRWLHLFEIGDLMPANSLARMKTRLKLPRDSDGKFITYGDMREYISSLRLSRAELELHVRNALTFFHSEVNSIGGALADQVQWRRRFPLGDRAELRPNQSLRWLYYQLNDSLKNGATSDVLIDGVAKLQTAMLASTRVTPESWAREALAPSVDRTSPVYDFICRSGAFRAGTQFYRPWCD